MSDFNAVLLLAGAASRSDCHERRFGSSCVLRYRRSTGVLTGVLPAFSRQCELPCAKVSSYIPTYRT